MLKFLADAILSSSPFYFVCVCVNSAVLSALALMSSTTRLRSCPPTFCLLVSLGKLRTIFSKRSWISLHCFGRCTHAFSLGSFPFPVFPFHKILPILVMMKFSTVLHSHSAISCLPPLLASWTTRRPRRRALEGRLLDSSIDECDLLQSRNIPLLKETMSYSVCGVDYRSIQHEYFSGLTQRKVGTSEIMEGEVNPT